MTLQFSSLTVDRILKQRQHSLSHKRKHRPENESTPQWQLLSKEVHWPIPDNNSDGIILSHIRPLMLENNITVTLFGQLNSAANEMTKGLLVHYSLQWMDAT